MVHVTSNLHKSDKFRGILLWIPVNCHSASRRASVLCLQNIHALSAERPCSVCRTSMLCLRNVHALSVHHCIICCVPTKQLTCKEDHRFPSRYSYTRPANHKHGVVHAQTRFRIIAQTVRRRHRKAYEHGHRGATFSAHVHTVGIRRCYPLDGAA